MGLLRIIKEDNLHTYDAGHIKNQINQSIFEELLQRSFRFRTYQAYLQETNDM